MKDAHCSYKLAGLLEKAGFDFSRSNKLVNCKNEILPVEILGYALACDGTEEPTATLQSVRSWLVDKGFRIEIKYSIPKDTYSSTIIRRLTCGTTTGILEAEFKDYDDCLEDAITYILKTYKDDIRFNRSCSRDSTGNLDKKTRN